MERMIEVCAGSLQDCLAAYRAGAKRVELNSALSVGGLTPTISTLRKVKAQTNLIVICMVRPRAAGFCYDEIDTELMFDEAKELLENGADGIAFGFLNKDGSINIENTRKMVELIHSYHGQAVFHRAFDVTPDAFQAIEQLIECKVDRILTSGQQAKAMDGIGLIKSLQEQYGNQIELLAGSGMNANNALEMMEKTGIWQVHSSCKGYLKDNTTTMNGVSYSYLSKPHENDYDIVEENLVRKLLESVK
ncbi:MAG: copper homeostasis protein CutC [Erysipelotrichaceae bacterium]|uniref:copper homeostasis protein CutC n=1 Tax=Floccifex sp. TaxID=2815810 RepID=UPI002A74BF65|nr:copper homeostasis protein CutC [Floccifex sp.]MDD7282087.1 copper homeostasis protein CutC [Erysipelotrichaceae bacterium]MDY2958779.1 copper homeostasis protein CutC [Floccifex sp.]